MVNLFENFYLGFREQFDGYSIELNSMLNPILPYQRHVHPLEYRMGDFHGNMHGTGKAFGRSLLHLPLGMLTVLQGALSIPRFLLDSFREYGLGFFQSLPDIISYGLGRTIALVLKGAIQIVTAPLSMLFAITTKPLASLVYKLFEYPLTLRLVKKQSFSAKDVETLVKLSNTPERESISGYVLSKALLSSEYPEGRHPGYVLRDIISNALKFQRMIIIQNIVDHDSVNIYRQAVIYKLNDTSIPKAEMISLWKIVRESKPLCVEILRRRSAPRCLNVIKEYERDQENSAAFLSILEDRQQKTDNYSIELVGLMRKMGVISADTLKTVRQTQNQEAVSRHSDGSTGPELERPSEAVVEQPDAELKKPLVGGPAASQLAAKERNKLHRDFAGDQKDPTPELTKGDKKQDEKGLRWPK